MRADASSSLAEIPALAYLAGMINLALIGLGRWGTNIWRTLNDIKGCQIKYVCEIKELSLWLLEDLSQPRRSWIPPKAGLARPEGGLERRRSARTLTRKEAGVKVLDDYKQLLAADDLDGVIIATPGSTHAKIALPFIKKGIPTFIEKPLTTSLADALTLQPAAKKARAIIFIGHIHLYNPAYVKAKQLAKKSGNIRYLFFEGMNNGPYRDDMSALWDWAPHDIAMALDLLGSKPKTVQAWGASLLRPQTNLYDFVQIKLEFPNKVPVFITNSWLAPEKRKRLTIVAYNDTVVVDDTAQQKIALYKNMGPHVTRGAVYHQLPKISHPSYGNQLPLKQELLAFIKAIRTKQQPITNLTQGLDVVKIIAAAEKSIALNGRKVRA